MFAVMAACKQRIGLVRTPTQCEAGESADLRPYVCAMTTLTPADLDPRRQAMLMYFQGYRVARIAEMLGEKVATVHSWKKRDKWGEYGPLDQMQLTTAARYCQLVMKEQKEGKDFKEIDLLARQSERQARIGKFNNGGNEADLNPNVANRNKGPRKPPEKNLFTDEQIEKLEEISAPECSSTSATGGMLASSTVFATS